MMKKKTYRYQTLPKFFKQLNPPESFIHLGRNDIENQSVGAIFRYKDKIIRIYHSDKWNAGICEKDAEGDYKCVLNNAKDANEVNVFLKERYGKLNTQ